MDEKISRKEYVKEKKEQCLKIIYEMIANGEKINFNNVRKKCNCSKSFLYNQLEIRELIEKYREVDGNLIKMIYRNISDNDSLSIDKIKIYLSKNFSMEHYKEIYLISKKYPNNISITKINTRDYYMKISYKSLDYYFSYSSNYLWNPNNKKEIGKDFYTWQVFIETDDSLYELIFTCENIEQFVKYILNKK